MEKDTEIKHTLNWNYANEGVFKAIVSNGKIAELKMCEIGAGIEGERCITTTNETYLRHVHSTLGELIKFIDEEQLRLGYSYANGGE